MIVRQAAREDWARLFAWRNDAVSVEQSFNNKRVPIQEHMKWLEKALADPNQLLLIGRDTERGLSIGVVRLIATKAAIAISVTIDAQQRGRGYAGQLLQEIPAAIASKRSWEAKRIVAEIKETNLASIRSFADAGYVYKSVKDGVLVMELNLE